MGITVFWESISSVSGLELWQVAFAFKMSWVQILVQEKCLFIIYIFWIVVERNCVEWLKKSKFDFYSYLKKMKLNWNSASHGCSNHPTTIHCWMIWWSQKSRSDVQPILAIWIDGIMIDFWVESTPLPTIICYKLD